MVGANFYKADLRQISFINSVMQYANIDNAKLNDINILESNFNNANISECKLKNFDSNDTQFIRTNFYKTSLKGIDFTKDQIGGFILSDNNTELNGAVVNPLQAVDLAKLLGVIIK
jgi:uncharacterized protein YjbI with pentapeptide repeats